MRLIILNGIFSLLIYTLFQCESSTNPIENRSDYNISDYNISDYNIDDSNLSDSLKNLYKADAAYLAMEEMNRDSVLKKEAVIPESLLLKYYHALIAVYNSNMEKAKKVKSIHDFRTETLREFIIGVDGSAAWFENWKNGNLYTGIGKFDNLVDSFNIEIKEVYDLHDRFAVVLTEEHVNLNAFPTLFNGITGIRHVEPNWITGDGSEISAQDSSGTLVLTYSIGWGDCPAGCINRHYWLFEITESAVTFLKETGDALPN